MIIGKDFEKIQWNIGDLALLEPNSLIGNTLIFIFSLLVYFNFPKDNRGFYRLWRAYFLVFGISFFLGGLGHGLYNYTGIIGRYPSWLLGMVSTYLAELAMVSIYMDKSKIKGLKKIFLVKFIVFVLAEILVFTFLDLEKKPFIGLRIPALYTLVGLSYAIGYLSVVYQQKINVNFRYFWMGALVLLPNVFIQSLKINIHPWFDRNDFSHVLLMIGCAFYFVAIRKVYTATKNQF